MAGREIVFVVFDGMKMLDVTGPAEVFAEANLAGADYSIRWVSPSGRLVPEHLSPEVLAVALG
ncbi:hypothetical protein SK854_26945 [Lentzea sp. BCCO 10_0061]|uniref:Uncharacterized protein n=1 Tax=Lentzea sokolovensis TaxID=3095429 RepID=A0ABU4V472_9PSEU|nr:hypothetical protein [Lentzea sp. BCCO 10_0061]MDX8145773.1 hypothetical protein [Lentzea sp. BCCO 10_0061]